MGDWTQDAKSNEWLIRILNFILWPSRTSALPRGILAQNEAGSGLGSLFVAIPAFWAKKRSLWEKHLPMPWPTGQHCHVIQIQFRGVVAAHKKRWTRWTNTDELTHDAGLVFSKVPWIGDWQTSLFKSFTAKWETWNRERPLPNASFSPSFYGWTILKNWLDGVASQSNPVGYIFGNKFGSVGVITPGSLAKSWILLHVLIQYSCGISQQGPLAHLGTSFWFLTFQAELLGTHSSLSILPNNTPTDVSSMQAAPSWQV